jgi:hypothetical protein
MQALLYIVLGLAVVLMITTAIIAAAPYIAGILVLGLIVYVLTLNEPKE